MKFVGTCGQFSFLFQMLKVSFSLGLIADSGNERPNRFGENDVKIDVKNDVKVDFSLKDFLACFYGLFRFFQFFNSY